jgi:glutamate-ammonia-ligase adenylyltransferase
MDAEHARVLLADAGFEDVEAAWRSLDGFLDSYAVRLIDERGRRRLQRMLPDLLRAVAAQPEPEATLGRVMAILETIARRSAYVALLRERPLALSQLVRLCAASPWIARHIRGHPVLLDELLDPRTLYAPLEPAALELDLTARLGNAPAGDEEQELEILRQFKHANVLRVAAADVARALPLMVVSDHLTEIAEALMRRILHLAWRDVAARYGRPGSLPEGPQGAHGFGIIAYGKLGGIELGYGSDLDLVFVHAGARRGSLTTGPTQVDDEVFYRRLGQRIIHLLTARMSSGVLSAVDSRLRPSGAKGELVNGIEGLGRYLRNDAWTWEHQALVRARMLAGDRNLRARFDDLRRDILLAPRDPDTLRTEVREMRARMRAHLGSGETPGFDLKQDPGGIADIEFMVQYATLRWADRLGDYAKFTDNIRLLEGLARAGLVAAEDTRALTDAYRAYRARVHAQALQEQGGAVPEADFEAHRDEVVRIWNRLMED